MLASNTNLLFLSAFLFGIYTLFVLFAGLIQLYLSKLGEFRDFKLAARKMREDLNAIYNRFILSAAIGLLLTILTILLS